MPPFDHLPAKQRRAMRSVLVINGTLLVVGGGLVVVAFVALGVASEGLRGLLHWQVPALILGSSPLWLGGLLMRSVGRRMPKE